MNRLSKQDSSTALVIHVVGGIKHLGGVQSHLFQLMSTPLPLEHGFQHFCLGVDRGIKLLKFSGEANIAEFLRLFFGSKKIIVHCHNLIGSKILFVVAIVRMLCGSNVKFVHHERGALWTYFSALRKVDRWFMDRADLILGNSRAACSLVQKVTGRNATTIYNFPISRRMPPFIFRGYVWNSRSSSARLKVGFIGRHDAVKGFDWFVKLAGKLRSKGSIEFHVLGFEREAVAPYFSRDALRTLNFQGRLSGSKLQFNMQALDLVVIPSSREPFGNVVWEAALLGLPIIAASVDGIREAIRTSGGCSQYIQRYGWLEERYFCLTGYPFLSVRKEGSIVPYVRTAHFRALDIRHGQSLVTQSYAKKLNGDGQPAKIASLKERRMISNLKVKTSSLYTSKLKMLYTNL